MAWRLAKSLEVLRKQINEAAPKRSKLSDGTVGDTSHSARKSDHNPNSRGVVNALDITHDPAHGVDIQRLADTVLASKDKRISYIICNGRIASGAGGSNPAFKWRKYTGANKHNKHVHFSVKDANGDDTQKWNIERAFAVAQAPAKAVPAAPAPVGPIKPKPAPAPAPASDKAIIANVQRRLKELGYNPGGDDGIIGPLTKGSVLSFRNDNSLPPSDIIDDEFLAALAIAKPRKMEPARANATVSEVSGKVPEARVHWWNRLWAAIIGGTTATAGAVDYIAPATGYLTSVKDFVGDVPPYVWIGGVVALCAVLYVASQYGAKKATEAFQAGDRR